MTPPIRTSSESLFLDVRGLRYHARVWGPPEAPKMFILHGWMDVAASFQFFVDALSGDWRVIAPDWRGYGETAWSGDDSYWFPDYYADLEVLLRHFSPDEPVNLIGHSMGGNVACIYAGARPARVRKLVNLEGFGMGDIAPERAPERIARWLGEIAAGARLRDYASFDALADRLRQQNPRLTVDRAAFLARHWGRDAGGRVVLRGDPAHKIVNPIPYRLAEAQACWRSITAPVLWVEGADTRTRGQLRLTETDVAARRACFTNLRLASIADAAHMLHHDKPERLAALVEDFLRD